jgi:predicted dehydrogenase
MTTSARIAVVGAGLIGQAHIKRVLEEPEAALAGIADPSPQSKAQAEGLGVAFAPDIETLLAQAKPDGVVIATPNQLHVPHGMAAVRAGVPMLLEKPVADDLDNALALATAAEQAGVPILVGHHPTVRSFGAPARLSLPVASGR